MKALACVIALIGCGAHSEPTPDASAGDAGDDDARSPFENQPGCVAACSANLELAGASMDFQCGRDAEPSVVVVNSGFSVRPDPILVEVVRGSFEQWLDDRTIDEVLASFASSPGMPSCQRERVRMLLPWALWGAQDGVSLFAIVNREGIDDECSAWDNAVELTQVLCP